MEEWEVDLPNEYENEEGAERFQLSLAAELELQMEQDEQQTKPLPEHFPNLKTSSLGGISWTLTGNGENAITRSAGAGTMFR